MARHRQATKQRPRRRQTKRILNCLPSPKQEEDWRYEHAAAAEIVAARAAIPTSKDLREDWWAIGDQGQTGSCVGWA
ncbi:MAG: hypothetical protein M3304_02505, partial [Actinomycetota bacterium]|nr:hypothetical protein [Actinomycetota bacterium]